MTMFMPCSRLGKALGPSHCRGERFTHEKLRKCMNQLQSVLPWDTDREGHDFRPLPFDFTYPRRENPMKKTAICCLALILLILLPLTALAEEPRAIGKVKATRGPASIVRDSTTRPALPSDEIYQSDAIVTGSDGAIGIMLEDNTLISMGPAGRLTVDTFKFAPAKNEYELRLHMMHGTFVYQSGLLGKLAPYAVELNTPVGRISMLKETDFKASFAE